MTELERVRESDVRAFSKRMGRLCEKPSRSRWFSGASLLLMGGFLGGVFGLIPFLSADPAPDAMAKLIYFGALGVTLVVAAVCGLAASRMRKERVESIHELREDFDDWLSAYEASAELEESV